MVQEQLFLWYKNSCFYGTRTTILMVQEQLFLRYKNNCFYEVRTTVLIPPLQSWTILDILGQSWTLLDILGSAVFLWLNAYGFGK